MKPEQYAKYAFVFDAFTRCADSPAFDALFSQLAASLPEGGSVIEVGGGTGLLTEFLLERRPDVRVTFIEPSPKMMVQARTRLGESHTFLEMTLDDALPRLDPHDAVIFSRVLYALHGELEPFLSLFERVRDKMTKPGGLVGIFELSQKFDVGLQKTRFSGLEDASLPPPPLLRKLWPIMERALVDFNEGVDAGEFYLFSLQDLESLIERTGFEVSLSKTLAQSHVLVARKRG